MIINRVRVRNFRCIKDETLDCSNQTALVGQNGCGKSSFLRAIELFYELSMKISEEDYYNKNTNLPIIISITFNDLTEEEIDLYKIYLDGTSLTVEKHIDFPGGKGNEKYYGSKLLNPDFQLVREQSTAKPKRDEYDILRQQYQELPSVTKADDIEPALTEWEMNNTDRCKRMLDSGQFFGFREVGNARLDRFTKFFLVPAVRDASEEVVYKKGSYLADLLDVVVMETVRSNPELEEFSNDVREKYKDLVSPEKLPELPRLAIDLTNTLQTYVPNAEVKLEWIPGEPNIPVPNTYAKLVEDDYSGDVAKKGHGLQRAFILTLLQHLAIVKGNQKEAEGSNEYKIPNLVIAIEEPELYQHPNRQRYLSNIFTQLASSGIGDVERVQIIYSTHSPLFVGIEKFDKIRIFRKVTTNEGEPKETKINFSTTTHIATRLDEYVNGRVTGDFTSDSLIAHIKNIMNPVVNEGFFSRILVLVEGESDQYAITTVAENKGIDLEKEGISVIPIRGKTNIPSPLLIFTSLGIPTYIVFDCDKSMGDKGKPDINALLLRMCGCHEEEFPHTNVKEKVTYFEENLETIFKEELEEELYNELLGNCCDEFGYRVRDGYKNPLVVCKMVNEAYKRGKNIPTLEKIVEAIMTLKS